MSELFPTVREYIVNIKIRPGQHESNFFEPGGRNHRTTASGSTTSSSSRVVFIPVWDTTNRVPVNTGERPETTPYFIPSFDHKKKREWNKNFLIDLPQN